MVTQFNLNEVLEKAVEKEKASQLLYENLSQRMKNPVAQNAFRELAREEREHQNLLEQYRSGQLKTGTLSREELLDYKIAEHFDQPEISPDMQLKDVFLLAANREMHSYDLYTSLAAIHTLGEVKSLFEQLASHELKHKHRLEFLYTEVAFPQTDGG